MFLRCTALGWGYSILKIEEEDGWTAFSTRSMNCVGMAVRDDGGWFKIFDHATGNFGNNLIDCISGSCEWEGTERFNAGCL